MNAIILILCWVVYGISIFRQIKNAQLGLWLGVTCGTAYFVLVPMTVLAVFGQILFFRARGVVSYVPDLVWANDRWLIFQILMMVLVYGVFDLLRLALPKRPELPAPPASETLRIFSPVHLFIGYLILAIFVFFASGLAAGGHWAESKAEYLQQSGVLGMLLVLLQSALRVCAFVMLLILYFRGRLTILTLAIPTGIICLVDLYTTGNRIFTLQALATIAVTLLIQRRWALIGTLSVLAIPVGYVMTIFPAIRSWMHDYNDQSVSGAIEAFLKAWERANDNYAVSMSNGEVFIGATEGINLNVMAGVMQVFPAQEPFMWGSSFIRVFFFAIPRSVWPEKPIPLNLLVGQKLMPHVDVSLAITTFGEFYANFGHVGVLLMPLAFWLANVAIRRTVKQLDVAAVVAFLFGVTVVRMSFSDMVLFFGITIFVLRFCRTIPHAPVAQPTAEPGAGQVVRYR